MSHTREPWKVMEPGKETEPSCASVCACEGMVNIYDAPLTMETEANAHLIAASPELLAACKDALVALDETIHCADLKATLRAAIAKAKGRCA